MCCFIPNPNAKAYPNINLTTNFLPNSKLRRAPTHPALWTVAGLVEDRLGEEGRAKKILEAALVRFPK
jgi:hypothetical protein